MSKLFSHAGVSRLHGKFKVRWANGAERVKVLIKGGHTDIDLIELKTPMTKEDAVAALLAMDFDNGNAEVRACLEAEAKKRKLEGWTDVKTADDDAEIAEIEAEILTNIEEEEATVIDITEEVAAPVRDSSGRFVRRSENAAAFAAWAAAAAAEDSQEDDAAAA